MLLCEGDTDDGQGEENAEDQIIPNRNAFGGLCIVRLDFESSEFRDRVLDFVFTLDSKAKTWKK